MIEIQHFDDTYISDFFVEFSTHEKAEEWVLMNKPLNISIKDLCPIIGMYNNTTHIDLDGLTKALKKLV